jgi:hypothetical protein
MAENPGTFGADLDKRLAVRIPVKAGVHTISATTILRSQVQRDNLIKPFMRTTIDGLDITGDPSVDRVTIDGPYGATGAGDTPSRRRILTCKPLLPRMKSRVRKKSCRQSHDRPTAAHWRLPMSTC